MPVANKRLSVEVDRLMSLVNKEAINPLMQELTIQDIEPIIKMVATARAKYIQELCKITKEFGDNMPKVEHVKKLQARRKVYEELVSAYQALDTAIERGYLDVKL